MIGTKLDILQENKDSASKKEPPNLIVGRDCQNHWIVVETRGLCGGIFTDKAAALRYAREESHGRPDAVRIVPCLITLNINAFSRHRVPAPY
jgi:hypothetical protein